jgi:glutamate-ammonia-ligase adenylyltransferase
MTRPEGLSRLALARVGLAEPSVALQLIEQANAPGRALLQGRIALLRVCADPDAALRDVLELAARRPGLADLDDTTLTRLLRVLGGSLGLAEFLLRRPEELDWFLAHDETPRDAETYRRSLLDAVHDAASPQDAITAMRRRYRRHVVQLAQWDLAAEDPRTVLEQVCRALADLADAAVAAGLEISRELVRPRFGDRVDRVRIAVIAMGKTGARELNYISDVDVIHVAEPVGDEDRSRALATATHILQTLGRVLGQAGPEPALWELDANLRPEGRDGALVRTLESHVAYYRRWAEGWEFQALLKARFMAGDAELGHAYIDAIRPMVWQSAHQEDFVASVQAMRERVSDNIPADQVDQQLKLGPGGLRDVEFTVQLLQLVHGQHDERIHGRGTLESLRALAENGYIGRREAQEFGDDYRTLRVIEHRLQLRRMRRTHLMPTDPEEQRVIARATRLAPDAAGLRALWARVKRSVRDLHVSIFYSPLLAVYASLPGEDFQLTAAHARDRLRAIGYRDPDGALDRITSLTTGVSRRAEIQRHLLPLMLELFARGSDPDHGLLAFTRISEQIGDAYWYLRMLRDSPVAARRLAHVLSCSRFIGDALASQPEAARWFADDAGVAPRGRDELEGEMLAIVRRHGPGEEQVVGLLQQVRRREVLRLAIWSVVHAVPVEQVSPALTDVYRALLSALTVWLDPERAHGIRLGIIGLGRFGGGELGFASDLDVMYVYEQVGERADIRGAAQRLAKAVQDFRMPVQLDLDLRPEGRKGAIMRTVPALAAYYERWAEPWERQALLRAAPGAGDRDLLDEAFAVIDRVRYGSGLTGTAERQIKRLKARMEGERLPRGTDASRHLKLGRGSLTDVEWVVQLEQLRHAVDHPSLRTTGTLQGLGALVEAGLLDADDAVVLREAWLFASRVRDANLLATGQPSDVIADPGGALEPAARVLGYEAGESARLDNDYLRATRRSRRVFERLFYGEG